MEQLIVKELISLTKTGKLKWNKRCSCYTLAFNKDHFITVIKNGWTVYYHATSFTQESDLYDQLEELANKETALQNTYLELLKAGTMNYC